MQFRAWTARAGVAHHPEVILLVPIDDVHFWIETGGKYRCPAVVRFLIKLTRISRVRACRRWRRGDCGEVPTLDEQLPSPGNGFALEVIAEGPVAEHLEKRVVVGVKPHIFQIIVLAAGTNAFLGVGGPSRHVGDLSSPRKIGTN